MSFITSGFSVAFGLGSSSSPPERRRVPDPERATSYPGRSTALVATGGFNSSAFNAVGFNQFSGPVTLRSGVPDPSKATSRPYTPNNVG